MLLNKFKSWFFVLLVLGSLFQPMELMSQNDQPTQEVEAEKKVDVKKLGRTGKKEDLFRFFGYEEPVLFRYLSMPFDSVMNSNLKEFTIEIGYLLLLLLPLALFMSPKVKPFIWVSILLLMVVFLSISIGTVYTNQHGLSADNALAHLQAAGENQSFGDAPASSIRRGYQWFFLQLFVPLSLGLSSISSIPDGVTYPVLLGIFLLVLFLLYKRFQTLQIEKRSLLLFSFFYGSLWLLVGSGLPWYGLLMFPLAMMLSVYGWGKNQKDDLFAKRLKQVILYGFAGIWLLMSISFRMSNFDGSSPKRAAQVFYPPLAMYRNGNFTEEKVTDMFRAGYPYVAKVINQESESLVYHASTQLPFFIEKSDRRCLGDNFFEFFINKKKVFKTQRRMNIGFKLAGFKYFIVDLKLPLVDKTPQKTLKRKFDEFMTYMYQNPEIELVATDRQVQMNSNGKAVNTPFANGGKVVKYGSFAVFRLK